MLEQAPALDRQGPSKLWLLLLIVVAAVLIWLVTTRSLAAYLAKATPEAALRIHPTEAKALLNLADAKFSGQTGQQSGQPSLQQGAESKDSALADSDRFRLWAELAAKTAQEISGEATGLAPKPASAVPPDTRVAVQNMVRLALSSDPTSARALTMLGELAYGAEDEKAADKFFQAAAARSLRERVAIYWLMLKSYQSRDYAATVRHADAILRTRSDVAQEVMPLLAQMAENKDASSEVKRVLLDNPPWRSRFLSLLAQTSTDPRATLDLLLAMRGTRTPPTADDIRSNVKALVARREYELAYYAWLEYLPPGHLVSTGFLFNGSFELPPSGVPFDWTIEPGVGATVDIADDPDQDGRRALVVEFGYGRVEFPGVHQLMMLAPGAYHFKAKHKGELVGKRGLVWRIACAEAPHVPIGESPMTLGVIPKWKDVEFAFTVPPADCRTQHIRLQLDARMPSEQLVSGSVWYDDLRVVPRGEDRFPDAGPVGGKRGP